MKKQLIIPLILLTASTAHAQMPWESPLQQILSSLQGTTAQILLTLAIIVAGLVFALGEAGGFFRRCAAIVFGGAIAVQASTFAPIFFGW